MIQNRIKVRFLQPLCIRRRRLFFGLNTPRPASAGGVGEWLLSDLRNRVLRRPFWEVLLSDMRTS